jgi:nucleotide-binding universal stress UspA family protein
MNAIVVGVDESPESKDALRWGIEEGRLRRVPVVALHAWFVPPLPPPVDVAPVVPPIDPSVVADLSKAAERLVERVVDEVVGESTDIYVRPLAVEGPPATVLVEAVTDDDLLVVGSHGPGGLKGLLLGSVSHDVVNHAPCPVLVHRHGHR